MSEQMPIICPSCQAVGRVPEEYAGRYVRCKHCQAKFLVGPARPSVCDRCGRSTIIPSSGDWWCSWCGDWAASGRREHDQKANQSHQDKVAAEQAKVAAKQAEKRRELEESRREERARQAKELGVTNPMEWRDWGDRHYALPCPFCGENLQFVVPSVFRVEQGDVMGALSAAARALQQAKELRCPKCCNYFESRWAPEDRGPAQAAFYQWRPGRRYA